MTLRHRELRDLAAFLPLGALGRRDAVGARLHLLRCGGCRRVARASRDSVPELLSSLPEATAPASLRARVLSSVADSKRAWSPAPRRFLVPALAIAVALSFIWLRGPETQHEGRSAVAQFELVGSPGSSQATAVVEWDAVGEEARFRVYGLAPLAPDSSYQLWRIRDGVPESVVVFDVDAFGARSVRFSLRGNPAGAAFAVSVEPLGGSIRPTGQIVLSPL